MEQTNKITLEEKHIDLTVLDYGTLEIMSTILHRDCEAINQILDKCTEYTWTVTRPVYRMLIDLQSELLDEWGQVIEQKTAVVTEMERSLNNE